MRKYQIYLRGQQKPIVLTENKEDYSPDSIKKLNDFFKSKLENYSFITDNDIITCRPSDVLCIHVSDSLGFGDQDLDFEESENITDIYNNDYTLNTTKNKELILSDLTIGGSEDEEGDYVDSLDVIIPPIPPISSLPPLNTVKPSNPNKQQIKDMNFDIIPSVVISKESVGY